MLWVPHRVLEHLRGRMQSHTRTVYVDFLHGEIRVSARHLIPGIVTCLPTPWGRCGWLVSYQTFGAPRDRTAALFLLAFGAGWLDHCHLNQHWGRGIVPNGRLSADDRWPRRALFVAFFSFFFVLFSFFLVLGGRVCGG